MIESFKPILLALHIYECWSRCVGKIQIERELLLKSSDYTEGEDFSLSQQHSCSCESPGTCHSVVGDSKYIGAYEALRVTN